MKTSLFQDEGYKFMGAAFEVYNEQGCGLSEEIYQESLEIELEARGIPFSSKQELTCFYKGRPLKRRYVPDLFVFDGLVIELKSVSQLLPEHEAQVLNYMRITKSPVGYLVNFGHKGELEWKRFVLSEYSSSDKKSVVISGDSRLKV
ncbi:MAG: GxxExxY protein [Akkermansiaceae bacterium]|nr:GxxExxY protein [Verrucomicrobiales bacterium]